LPFYPTQLGRFGTLGVTLTGLSDPDLQAAHLYALNGTLTGPRPTLQDILASKGLWDPNDPLWQHWLPLLGTFRNHYMAAGGHPLTTRCPLPWRSFPPGSCAHELTPPLSHWNLRGFSQRLPNLPDNIVTHPNGAVSVDPASRPMWLYIVTRSGEILVASEDYEWIKHPCIAGGLEVWSAGQLGIENHQIRLADLQSGHYVRPSVGVGTNLARELAVFTRTVFEQYTRTLMPSITCLHPGFDCVWI
jgi:hypothetical protein